MESKWRQNVAVLGLDPWVTMAARVTNVPWVGYLVAPKVSPRAAAVYQDSGGDRGWVQTSNVLIEGGNFPYGWDVEPDR